MAKQVTGIIKLQIRGGQANPAPPVGPALGAKGVNIMDFCKQFNARTQDKPGKVLPAVITVYIDKSFDFIIKTPPVAVQLKEIAKIKSGSPEPNRQKVASVTLDQVKTIAEEKMPDLNAFTVESAMKMVVGTARSMGITIKGQGTGTKNPNSHSESSSKPEISDQNIEVNDQNKATGDQQLVESDQNPETSDRDPESIDQNSATSDQQVESGDQNPVTNNRETESTDQNSETGDHQSETGDQNSETNNQ